jgi:hypothetical protein
LPKRLILTSHAEYRLRQRGLNFAWVEETVLHRIGSSRSRETITSNAAFEQSKNEADVFFASPASRRRRQSASSALCLIEQRGADHD